MKETKPYWYPDTGYSMTPFFICIHFPNLIHTNLYIMSLNIDSIHMYALLQDKTTIFQGSSAHVHISKMKTSQVLLYRKSENNLDLVKTRDISFSI